MNQLKSRPWALLFVASLAINLFLAGMLTARWLHRSGMNGAAAMGPMGLRYLGPEAQPIVKRAWAGRKDDMAQRMRSVRDSKKRAAATLSADPFDPARASAALADYRASVSSVQQTAHEALIEMARDLTPAQRKKLHRAIEMGPGPGARIHPRVDDKPDGETLESDAAPAPVPSR